MLFGDFVRDPQFSLSVIVGDADSLRRPVTGAYITDLPDPSRFLSPGMLVLSSGLWIDRPGGTERFLDAIVRTGATALIVGMIELGHLPDELIQACRTSGVVLATLTDDVSFASIVDVARGRRTAVGDPVEDLAERVGEAVADEGPDAAVALVREELSIECWVVDDRGRVVAASAAPSAERAARLWNRGAHGVQEEADPDAPERPSTVWGLGGPPGAGTALLVADSDADDLDDAALRVLATLAGALRIWMRYEARLRDEALARCRALVSALRDAVPPSELSALLRIAGLVPQGPMRVWIAEAADPAFPSTAVLGVLERLVTDGDLPFAACTVGSTAVIIANVRDEEPALLRDRIRSRFPGVSPVLGGRRLLVAVSDTTVGSGLLGVAYAAATARLLDATGPEQLVLADTSASDSHRALLRMVGDQARAAFAESVLRPLLDYDVRNGADLVGTVRGFLASGGSWQEASRLLHVHPNTLRYRIGRVEDLTERDLGSMEDRVDLFLALACWP